MKRIYKKYKTGKRRFKHGQHYHIGRKSYGMVFRQPFNLSKECISDIDPSIKQNIKKINQYGFRTNSSCSGISKDHKKCENTLWKLNPHLAVALPDDVVKSKDLSVYVSEDSILKPKIIDNMIDAGKKAGWYGHLAKYDLIQPVIHFETNAKTDIERKRAWDKLTKSFKETDIDEDGIKNYRDKYPMDTDKRRIK